MDIRLGSEGSGADEWRAEAAEEDAARLRLRGAAVDIFDPEELPAHLVRTALHLTLLLVLQYQHAVDSLRPGLCVTQSG